VTFLANAISGPYYGVPFAIKVFRKLSKPERRNSFLKEIEFLEQCNHPAIMRVFDKGVFRKQHPFVVAEYLPNTLHEVLKGDEVSTIVKLSYTMQLVSALAYLDNLNPAVIHRDIKPKNIFVKGLSCILGDFGLLKHVDTKRVEDDREMLKESAGAGMPLRYRTPDQVAYLRGEKALTPKSDVFQLGLVLAELFTGQNPEKLAAGHMEPVELEPLAKIPGEFSAAITTVLQRMLEPDATARNNAARFRDPWNGIFQAAILEARARRRRPI
jgi:serine/threonine protein kinase